MQARGVGAALVVASMGMMAPNTTSAFEAGIAMGLSDAFSCNQCHNSTGSFTELAPPEVAPLMVLEVMEGDLSAGTATRLRLTAQSQDNQGQNRALGFDLAVGRYEQGLTFAQQERSALKALSDGTYVVDELGDLVQREPLGFDEDGLVQIEFEYTPTTNEAKAFYVALNDVNLNQMAGADDWVSRDKVCFVPEDAMIDETVLTDCTVTLDTPLPLPEPEPEPEPPKPPQTPDQQNPNNAPNAQDNDNAPAPNTPNASNGGCTLMTSHKRSSPAIGAFMLGLLILIKRRLHRT